jgi:hypothetical protein
MTFIEKLNEALTTAVLVAMVSTITLFAVVGVLSSAAIAFLLYILMQS